MRLIIERLIRFFTRIGIIKDCYRIVYSGQGVSLNLFYSQDNFFKRKKAKDKYRKIFNDLLEESSIQWMNEFAIIMFYWSRHDVDNAIGLEKMLLDSIKQEKDKSSGRVIRNGYAFDDDKRYFKGLVIWPDENLPHNTFEFLILKLK